MKLSMMLAYSGDPVEAAAGAADLERAGIDVGWVPELYGFDAVSILGYLAASTETMQLGAGILPIYSRTPTLTAMTAAGLDAVTRGRFILGIGASGPQVIEGWHGVPYDNPVSRQEELIEICRMVWRRDVVEYHGPNYDLPLPLDRGSGLGKPLKLIDHPVREDIPIHIAALGPKNVELTARVAHGWLPAFFHPERADSVWGEPLAKGLAERDPALPPLEISAGGAVAICGPDDARRIRDASRSWVALYVGGMGARGQNFYNNIFRAYGYEDAAATIQDLYLEGRKEDAMAAVPDDYLEATTLAGDEGFVRERIEAFRAAGVTLLQVSPAGPDPLRTVEKVKSWVS